MFPLGETISSRQLIPLREEDIFNIRIPQPYAFKRRFLLLHLIIDDLDGMEHGYPIDLLSMLISTIRLVFTIVIPLKMIYYSKVV